MGWKRFFKTKLGNELRTFLICYDFDFRDGKFVYFVDEFVSREVDEVVVRGLIVEWLEDYGVCVGIKLSEFNCRYEAYIVCLLYTSPSPRDS